MLRRQNCQPGKLLVELTSRECFSIEVPGVEGLQPTRIEYAHASAVRAATTQSTHTSCAMAWAPAEEPAK
jgi:hypothetical protein